MPKKTVARSKSKGAKTTEKTKENSVLEKEDNTERTSIDSSGKRSSSQEEQLVVTPVKIKIEPVKSKGDQVSEFGDKKTLASQLPPSESKPKSKSDHEIRRSESRDNSEEVFNEDDRKRVEKDLSRRHLPKLPMTWMDRNSPHFKPWAQKSAKGSEYVYDTFCQKDLLVSSLYGKKGHLKTNPKHLEAKKKIHARAQHTRI